MHALYYFFNWLCGICHDRDSKHSPLICKPVCFHYATTPLQHYFYLFITFSILGRWMTLHCIIPHSDGFFFLIYWSIDFLGQLHDWQCLLLYFFWSVCSGLSSIMLLLEFELWSSPHGSRNSGFEPWPFELETNVLPLHHCETYLISW